MKKLVLAMAAVALTSGLAMADAAGPDSPGGTTGALDIRQQSLESQTVGSKEDYALQVRRSAGGWNDAPQPIHENSRDFAGNR